MVTMRNATLKLASPSTLAARASMNTQRAAQILGQNFHLFDAAASGTRDGQITQSELQAVVKSRGLPEEVRHAAQFLLENPAAWNLLRSQTDDPARMASAVICGNRGVSGTQLDSYQRQATSSSTNASSSNSQHVQSANARSRPSTAKAYRSSSALSSEQEQERAFKLLKQLKNLGVLPESLFQALVNALTGQAPAPSAPPASTSPAPAPSTSPTPPSSQQAPKQTSSSAVGSKAVAASGPGTSEKDDISTKEALQAVAKYFDIVAAGDDDTGLISRADLRAVLKQPALPDELKRAARFLLQNSSIFDAMEVAGTIIKVKDGQASYNDLMMFLYQENLRR